MTTNVRKNRVLGLALTTALASATLAGCAGKAAPPANVSATKAQSALTKGKSTKAVEHAESAVQAEPRNAAFRATLGAAYMEAGRFRSAATSFDDAMKLGDTSPRTALSLALALTATGKSTAARGILRDWQNEIAPSDLGLALTLAGDPQRGVHVLSGALRGGQNNAKVRQNLAYSLAMAGQWREARIMAAQDVPADKVGARMEQWAAAAQSGKSAARIATLLNVRTDFGDPGQPVQLALNNNPTAEQLAAEVHASSAEFAAAPAVPAYNGGELPPLDMAQAPAPASAPAMVPVSTAAAPAQVDDEPELALENYPAPKVEEPKSFSEAFDAPAPKGASIAQVVTDAVRFVSEPVVQKLPARNGVEPKRTARKASSGKTKSGGSHLIQLGSFASEQGARRAWGIYTKRHPELAGQQMVITEAKVRGKRYWRVSAGGFASASARSMCSKVKRKGNGCITWAESKPLPGAINSGRRLARR